MGFDVAAEDYGRFMGRFSVPLAQRFADHAGVAPGMTALDVGCGPGALTGVLVSRLGPAAVAAIDPSPSFVEAARGRYPGVDVRVGAAERLPFADRSVDLALAQLVVHFMSDPVDGLREMARVTRTGGRVAACVWDHSPGGGGPLSQFWAAVSDLDPDAAGEAGLAGAREGHLEELFRGAGMTDLRSQTLTVTVGFPTFADWWDPFCLGVGPAGAHVAALDGPRRERLRRHVEELLPEAPFEVSASAWSVCAIV